MLTPVSGLEEGLVQQLGIHWAGVNQEVTLISHDIIIKSQKNAGEMPVFPWLHQISLEKSIVFELIPNSGTTQKPVVL